MTAQVKLGPYPKMGHLDQLMGTLPFSLYFSASQVKINQENQKLIHLPLFFIIKEIVELLSSTFVIHQFS